MKYVKTKPGFIDFYVGRFPIILAISAFLIMVMSFLVYDGLALDSCILKTYKILGEVVQQFNVVVESRVNQGRSMVLMLGGVVINFFAFFAFLWLIPASHLRESYLRSNLVRNYVLLSLSCLFFLMTLVVGLYKTFDIDGWSVSRGRFAEIILPVIESDAGLGLLFLVLLMVTAYSFATILKTMFVHVRTV